MHAASRDIREALRSIPDVSRRPEHRSRPPPDLPSSRRGGPAPTGTEAVRVESTPGEGSTILNPPVAQTVAGVGRRWSPAPPVPVFCGLSAEGGEGPDRTADGERRD